LLNLHCSSSVTTMGLQFSRLYLQTFAYLSICPRMSCIFLRRKIFDVIRYSVFKEQIMQVITDSQRGTHKCFALISSRMLFEHPHYLRFDHRCERKRSSVSQNSIPRQLSSLSPWR
jgi:hypothetical protein